MKTLPRFTSTNVRKLGRFAVFALFAVSALGVALGMTGCLPSDEELYSGPGDGATFTLNDDQQKILRTEAQKQVDEWGTTVATEGLSLADAKELTLGAPIPCYNVTGKLVETSGWVACPVYADGEMAGYVRVNVDGTSSSLFGGEEASVAETEDLDLVQEFADAGCACAWNDQGVFLVDADKAATLQSEGQLAAQYYNDEARTERVEEAAEGPASEQTLKIEAQVLELTAGKIDFSDPGVTDYMTLDAPGA